MIIPYTQRIYIEYLGFIVVYLDKEPVRLDRISMDILDEKVEICRSKRLMQGKKKEKIRKIVI